MKIIRIILLVFLVTGITEAQSLREAVELALRNNPTVNARTEAVQAARSAAESAYSRSLPSVNLDATYRYQSEIAHFDFARQLPPNLGGLLPSTSIGAYDNYELGLMGQYALFTGFAEQAAIDMARKQVTLSETNLEKSRKEITFRTIIAYRTVQNLTLSEQTLQKAAQRADLQLQRVKSLVNQGMALVVDTLSLSLSKMNYQHELLRVQAEIEKTRQSLTMLTKAEISVEPVQVEEVDFKIAELRLSGSEDIRMIDIQQGILTDSKKLKQAAYYPNIGIFAGYKYGNPGPDVVNKNWIDWGVAGVSLNWNLFSWGADKKAVQQQEAELRRLKAEKAAAVDQITLNYRNAVRDYQMLRDQLKVTKAALQVAESKLHMIETSYRQGMETVTEFNDSNLDLTMKELEYKIHLVKILIKINEIDLISGNPLTDWSDIK